MIAVSFNAGVVIGFIGGMLFTGAFILGLVAEDRWDILSLVNRHKGK